MMAILCILLGFMIVGSIIAVETRDLLSSVISVGAVGFALCVAFLILGAPDIAIVQILVEIVCLIMLLRLTVTRDDTTIEKHIETFAVAAVLVFGGIFLGVSYYMFRELPQFGEPVMKVSAHYIQDGVAKTQAANLVTGVLLDFRAYDTLGEATVLFASIVGAVTILRKRGRKRGAEE